MTVFNSYQTYVKSLNTNSSTSCTPGSNKEMLQCGK